MKHEEQKPIIGVASIIVKDGKVLLGKRIGKHGGGTWAPPGGKLDFNEEFADAVKRETLEETGLRVNVKRFIGVTNNIFKKEKRHSITLFYLCSVKSGKLRTMEPEKCEGFDWFDKKRLPSPLFLPVQRLIRQRGGLF